LPFARRLVTAASVSAGLFHRELRKVGVEIHYAVGAGDPSTAEGGLLIALQQAFDEYERRKLSRETKRGMRQGALQGFRNDCRPPHGYRLQPSPHPVAARAKAGETKTRLVPDEERRRWSPRSSISGPTAATDDEQQERVVAVLVLDGPSTLKGGSGKARRKPLPRYVRALNDVGTSAPDGQGRRCQRDRDLGRTAPDTGPAERSRATRRARLGQRPREGR
jgi:hypothetical protein